MAWGYFPVALFVLPKYFIVDIGQYSSSSKFHSVFVSPIPCPCIKLMTNKLQPLPCKITKTFSVDALIT